MDIGKYEVKHKLCNPEVQEEYAKYIFKYSINRLKLKCPITKGHIVYNTYTIIYNP